MTDQEAFWAGDFGHAYTRRNAGDLITANVVLFSKILSRAGKVRSILELGANVGDNLKAIRTLLPDVELAAVEINSIAANKLREIPGVDVFEGSIFDYRPQRAFDLVLFKGVLIHIAPEHLRLAYGIAFDSSARFVCLCEYYSMKPTAEQYRGHDGKLFKRDFAGEMLDHFPLRLHDYGFAYHRDSFPQDDMTWFLLEKHRPVSTL